MEMRTLFMKSALLRKGIIALTITVMFIGMGAIPSTGITVVKNSTITISNGNILYVGGSGEGNYTKIQDAIDNASNGDTVFVYNSKSPYYEQLVITKTINLISKDKHTTVIDAQHKGTPVEISDADNCLVSGFTIKNCKLSGSEYQHAVIEIFRSDYVIIKGNILTIGDTLGKDWTCAVELDNCMYCNIQNNFIFEDDYKGSTAGVSLHEGSSHNTISGNDISNYTIGIETFVLNYNLFDSNNYNIILGNHIHHNLNGIAILGDTYNEILNNRIEHSESQGIRNVEAHHTTISGNIILYNGDGEEFDCGIMLTFETKDNYISDNVISKNNPTGIYMLSGVDNVVTRNNFIDNWGDSGEPKWWWGNACFSYVMMKWGFRSLNRWWRNYWSDSRGILPKLISGDMTIFGLFIFPWFEFDLRPRIISYNIGTA